MRLGPGRKRRLALPALHDTELWSPLSKDLKKIMHYDTDSERTANACKNYVFHPCLFNIREPLRSEIIGLYDWEERDVINRDSGRVCYGVEDTLKALELRAVETLIVFENLEINRSSLDLNPIDHQTETL